MFSSDCHPAAAFEPEPAANYGIFLLSAHESVISGIVGRYAVAPFDLMNELPESDQQLIHTNVAGFKDLLDDNAICKICAHPVIVVEEQAVALGTLLEQANAHQLFRNFVALVVQTGAQWRCLKWRASMFWWPARATKWWPKLPLPARWMTGSFAHRTAQITFWKPLR